MRVGVLRVLASVAFHQLAIVRRVDEHQLIFLGDDRMHQLVVVKDVVQLVAPAAPVAAPLDEHMLVLERRPLDRRGDQFLAVRLGVIDRRPLGLGLLLFGGRCRRLSRIVFGFGRRLRLPGGNQQSRREQCHRGQRQRRKESPSHVAPP